MIRPEDRAVDIGAANNHEESECLLRFWPGNIPIGDAHEAGEAEVTKGRQFVELLAARGTRAGFLEGMYLALKETYKFDES